MANAITQKPISTGLFAVALVDWLYICRVLTETLRSARLDAQANKINLKTQGTWPDWTLFHGSIQKKDGDDRVTHLYALIF